MTGEDEEEVQVVVRFVIPRGKTEVTVSEALSEGFDQSQEAGLGPMWVEEDEILTITPTKTVRSLFSKLLTQFYMNSGCFCDGSVFWASI